MGRRVQKTVYAYGSGSWQVQKVILFVYDGWNLIKETTIPDGGSAVDKFYVWGLDLSQSLQGAGGVGGLLAVVDGSLTYQYFCDANGNVGQVVNASDGSVTAHYEYDPFGNMVSQIGDYAGGNPYRFSTKYQDAVTTLYYYGYRYYSTEIGRWLNKDPIEEKGGNNLYGFINNSSVNTVDILGLDFIALAGRPLGKSGPNSKNVNLLMSHLSIEYWDSPCPAKEGKEYFSGEFMKNVKGSKIIHSVELLQDDRNWYAWKKFSAYGNTSISYYWAEVKVGVSVIAYDTSSANRFIAVYQPKKDNKTKVQNMWQTVINGARSYRWAEQSVVTGRKPRDGGFAGNFKNWPNSKYFYPPGNNSNSFARWIVKMIMNEKIPNLYLFFPGRNLPIDVSRDWSSKPPILK